MPALVLEFRRVNARTHRIPRPRPALAEKFWQTARPAGPYSCKLQPPSRAALCFTPVFRKPLRRRIDRVSFLAPLSSPHFSPNGEARRGAGPQACRAGTHAGACAAHPAPNIEQTLCSPRCIEPEASERHRLLYRRRRKPFQTGVERSLDAAGLGARATSRNEAQHSSGKKCGLAPRLRSSPPTSGCRT